MQTIGYGWDSWHTQQLTETLEQTTLAVVDDTACNVAIAEYLTQTWSPSNYTAFLTALGIDPQNTEEEPPNILQCTDCIICAVGKYVYSRAAFQDIVLNPHVSLCSDTDSCNGDSGSPLITGSNMDNAIQIGVVS